MATHCPSCWAVGLERVPRRSTRRRLETCPELLPPECRRRKAVAAIKRFQLYTLVAPGSAGGPMRRDKRLASPSTVNHETPGRAGDYGRTLAEDANSFRAVPVFPARLRPLH